MDCRSDAGAASAGSILVTRLMMRGAAGLVTDGGLRDTPEISDFEIPTYIGAPSAPTNMNKHHAVETLNEPIGCGGVAVNPGDRTSTRLNFSNQCATGMQSCACNKTQDMNRKLLDSLDLEQKQ